MKNRLAFDLLNGGGAADGGGVAARRHTGGGNGSAVPIPHVFASWHGGLSGTVDNQLGYSLISRVKPLVYYLLYLSPEKMWVHTRGAEMLNTLGGNKN